MPSRSRTRFRRRSRAFLNIRKPRCSYEAQSRCSRRVDPEIEPDDLKSEANSAQHAALGALSRLQAWFNNPCKFYWKRDGVPLESASRDTS
jgi:hypothetical protein